MSLPTLLNLFQPGFAVGRASFGDPERLERVMLSPNNLDTFSRSLSAVFKEASELKKEIKQPAGGWRLELCDVERSNVISLANRDFPRWTGQVLLVSAGGSSLYWDIRPIGSASVFSVGLSTADSRSSAIHSVTIDFQRKTLSGTYVFSRELPPSASLVQEALALAFHIYISGQFPQLELSEGFFIKHWRWGPLAKHPYPIPLMLGENGFLPSESVRFDENRVGIFSGLKQEGKPALSVTGQLDPVGNRRSLVVEISNAGRADEGPRPLATSLEKLFL